MLQGIGFCRPSVTVEAEGKEMKIKNAGALD